MKNSNSLIILFCMTCMFMLTACDQTNDKHYTVLQPNDNASIGTRGDCEECPGINECCCYVLLEEDGDDDAYLVFCGTSNGPDLCSPAPSCTLVSFSGLGETITLLDPSPRRAPFCMDGNGGFWIYNSDGSDVANIILSCQADLTHPDTVHLHIQPQTKVYFKTNGSCVLDPCL